MTTEISHDTMIAEKFSRNNVVISYYNWICDYKIRENFYNVAVKMPLICNYLTIINNLFCKYKVSCEIVILRLCFHIAAFCFPDFFLSFAAFLLSSNFSFNIFKDNFVAASRFFGSA